MTAIESAPNTGDSLGDCLLPGAIIDALVEGATAGTDRVARAEAMNGIIREIFASVTWRYADNADPEELAGMHHLIAEAETHLDRMRFQATSV